MGAVANSVLAIVKLIAGIAGNSYVLVADAIESLTDVASSCVVLLGLKIAARPPSSKYPYGRGRAETFSALFVSFLLLIAAVGIAIESVRQITTVHSVPASYTLAVVIVVVLIKEALFRWAFKIGSSLNSAAIQADAWHHRSDAITSAAAFLGISVALIGGPGYESADDWAALFAAGIILLNAFLIARPAIDEMFDRSPDPNVVKEIRSLAESVDGVLGTHKCFVRKLGLELFVDLDVVVDAEMSVRESHSIAHRVQDLVREQLPVITKVLVHIEPPREFR